MALWVKISSQTLLPSAMLLSLAILYNGCIVARAIRSAAASAPAPASDQQPPSSHE
jgi:hypothetical protein